MSKTEDNGQISYAFLFIVLYFVTTSIYVFFIVPTYPKIDKSLRIDVINSKIKSQIEQNISQVSLEYADDKKKRLKLKKAIHIMANNMSECKTKECLIDEYEDFMDDWVSTETKGYTRYYYLLDLGIIGKILIYTYEDLMSFTPPLAYPR